MKTETKGTANMVCDCCGIILERGLDEPVTVRCAGCILAGKSPK